VGLSRRGVIAPLTLRDDRLRSVPGGSADLGADRARVGR
jgi:hypothetical protein